MLKELTLEQLTELYNTIINNTKDKEFTSTTKLYCYDEHANDYEHKCDDDCYSDALAYEINRVIKLIKIDEFRRNADSDDGETDLYEDNTSLGGGISFLNTDIITNYYYISDIEIELTIKIKTFCIIDNSVMQTKSTIDVYLLDDYGEEISLEDLSKKIEEENMNEEA